MKSSRSAVTIFVMISASFLINGVISCCRPAKRIYFDPVKSINCEVIPGAYKLSNGLACVFKTCNDLLDHGYRRYCSKYFCDYFPCNCFSECFEYDEDAWQGKVSDLEGAFAKKYGKVASLVSRSELIDRIMMDGVPIKS